MSVIATLAVALTANNAGFVAGMSEGARAAQGFGNATQEVRKALSDSTPITEKYESAIELLTKKLNDGKISFEQFERASDSLREKFKEASGGSSGFAESIMGGLETAGVIAAVDVIGELIEKTVEVAKELAEFVHQSMESAVAAQHMADATGFTVEAFTKLEYAARAVDVPAETLSQSITRLEVNIGKLAESGGPAADKLAKLGLNMRQLASESPQQAFEDVAEGLSKIENVYARNEAARALFGRGFAQLLPLLKEGKEGIEAFGDAGEKAGFVLTAFDTAKVEESVKSLNQLEAVVAGIGRQLAVGLSPYIAAATEAMRDFATSGDGIGASVKIGIDTAIGAVGMLADAFQYMEQLNASVTGEILAANKAVIDALHAAAAVLDILSAASGGLQSHFADAISKYQADVQKAIIANESLKEAVNGKWASESIDEYLAKLQKIADARAATEAAKEKSKTRPTTGIEGTDKDISELQKLVDEMEKVKQAREGLSKADIAAANVAIETEDPAAAAHAYDLARQYDAMEKQQQEIEDNAKAWDEYDKGEKQVQDSINNTIAKLQEQAATFGMTRAQIDLYRLAQEHADASQIAAATAAEAKLDGLEKEKKYLAEVKRIQEEITKDRATPDEAERLKLADSGFSADQVDYLAGLEKQRSDIEKANQIRKELESPTDKVGDKVKEINELFAHGALTTDEYARAIHKLHDELDSLANRSAQSFDPRYMKLGGGLDTSFPVAPAPVVNVPPPHAAPPVAAPAVPFGPIVPRDPDRPANAFAGAFAPPAVAAAPTPEEVEPGIGPNASLFGPGRDFFNQPTAIPAEPSPAYAGGGSVSQKTSAAIQPTWETTHPWDASKPGETADDSDSDKDADWKKKILDLMTKLEAKLPGVTS